MLGRSTNSSSGKGSGRKSMASTHFSGRAMGTCVRLSPHPHRSQGKNDLGALVGGT
jgi:hypothetical protein